MVVGTGNCECPVYLKTCTTEIFIQNECAHARERYTLSSGSSMCPVNAQTVLHVSNVILAAAA